MISLPPSINYEQTIRILAELDILKKRLAISENTAPVELEHGKDPTDVFNKLRDALLQIGALNNEEISPNYVFAEIMRGYEDITVMLQALHIEDRSFPPAKKTDAEPKDSLAAAFDLMKEIQRLQRDAGIERTDFTPFYKTNSVSPSEVLIMIGMCLTELQTLKAYMDLKYITPPAQRYYAKTPADVHQLTIWLSRRLSLIQTVK
ncbi:hypothetical protein MCHI_001952 [Candidatus Magnetoovum chiemensis]|nr:hypothetical protein MCHI_001952 [Candidatus Magnetoovum chiemensis]